MRGVAFALLAALSFGVVAGTQIEGRRADYNDLGPERTVAAMPGVGSGWLDTLRRVVGPLKVDTVSTIMLRDFDGSLLGLFEPWHNTVNLNPRMIEFTSFIRRGGGSHPLTIANPAGVVAHEFGHAFQFSIWLEHGSWECMPDWANDGREHFADRFARVMLAIRGWDEPDREDLVLYHQVRYRLLKSYWPKEN